jgi:Cytochrome c554 and c-prime
VNDPQSPVYPLNVVKTCTSCHSNATIMKTYNPSLAVDQLEKYRTSVHGMRNAKGDPNVAECASCHGSHNIRSHTDAKSRVYPLNIPKTCAECHSNPEHMKPYGIPTDQYEKFAGSVHGKALLIKQDLGAPACNSCHGNHGAAPPGVESVSKVCGTCHALNADLFSSSPHKKAFDDLGLPECATCHGNHDIEPATSAMLGVSDEAVCSQCHSPTDYPKGYATALDMRTLTDSLVASEDSARALVHEAEQKGMAIGEAKFTLRSVRQARLESRTEVHAFNDTRFRNVVTKGFAAASIVRRDAEGAISEYYFRRIGLGIATLIITLLVIVLYLYIKRLEQHQHAASHQSAQQ